MKRLNSLKKILGGLLILISVIGCIPILLSMNVSEGRIKNYRPNTNRMEMTPNDNKAICDTNYPILIGLFAIAGSLLISSIKEE